jgi:hypothetical protein
MYDGIVMHLPEIGCPERSEEWWMADVTFIEGGARNSNVPTLFQVVDVDSGVVRWVNADLTTHIVPSFRRQDTKYKVMLTRASPTRNTPAISDASGKNLAITEPTPRNTDEMRMAVRSVHMRRCG